MRLCTQPFKGALKPPRDHKRWNKEDQSKAPDIETVLEYVHGYRAKDQRNNIRYLKNGNIAYTAAAVAIIMDIKTNSQKFYNEHKDDITAFDVSVDGTKAVTGDTGAKPFLYVWDVNTLQTTNVFRGLLKRGVDLVAFTPDGNKIAATGRDDDHQIAIYDLTNKVSKGGSKVLDQQGGRDIMLELRWKNDAEFVTVGPKHFKVWTVKGKPGAPTELYLFSDKGKWGKNDVSDKLTTVAINGPDCVAGAQDGSVQIFDDTNRLKNFKKLHSRAVQAITLQQNLLFTGGNDSKINILNPKDYALVMIIKENTFQDSLCSKIRSINLHANSRQLIVGTYASEIYELTTKDPKIDGNTIWIPKKVLAGHYTPNQTWTNEVWGLCMFPNNKDLYATCSDDATLRIWSISQRKQLNATSTNIDDKGKPLPPDPETKDLREGSKGRSIQITPDGNFIIVGSKEGTIRIYTKSLKIFKIIKDSNEEVSDIKVSPNGLIMAVGSHDNEIYLYKIPTFEKFGKSMRKHSSYITHIDFTEDSRYLRSTCGAYELLFWDLAKGGVHLPSGASLLRDDKWATHTCPIGWGVQGIWKPGYDGTDINAVDRSNLPFGNRAPHDYHLVAVGDDDSKLNILRFPSLKYGSEPVQSRGHSSHVTNVKFSKDDKRVMSTGGEDQCVFQWRINKKEVKYPPLVRANSARRPQSEQASRNYRH